MARTGFGGPADPIDNVPSRGERVEEQRSTRFAARYFSRPQRVRTLPRALGVGGPPGLLIQVSEGDERVGEKRRVVVGHEKVNGLLEHRDHLVRRTSLSMMN